MYKSRNSIPTEPELWVKYTVILNTVRWTLFVCYSIFDLIMRMVWLKSSATELPFYFFATSWNETELCKFSNMESLSLSLSLYLCEGGSQHQDWKRKKWSILSLHFLKWHIQVYRKLRNFTLSKKKKKRYSSLVLISKWIITSLGDRHYWYQYHGLSGIHLGLNCLVWEMGIWNDSYLTWWLF